MARSVNLTHERLTQLLDYDPATGVFTWKVRSSNRIKVGDRAGAIGVNGHRYILVSGEKFQASRLAWFYLHATWPAGDIKMLNGNLDDCSQSNLQEMSRIEAARLRGALSTNTTGFRGVSTWKRGLFKAAVTANYKQVNLGVFKTAEDASRIYERAMSVLADAKTPEACDVALDQIIQERRKRVAWDRLLRSGRSHSWTSFDAFCSDVGHVDGDESTVTAIDESLPVGGKNFRWLGRPDGEFDRSTKSGAAAYMKAYRTANPGRWRHNHLKKNYQIDEIEFNRMKAAQGGLCMICESEPIADRLAVDHCHATGLIRGLLCKPCNYGLGQFRDDPVRLRRAAEFLEGRTPRESSAPTYVGVSTIKIFDRLRLMEVAGNG